MTASARKNIAPVFIFSPHEMIFDRTDASPIPGVGHSPTHFTVVTAGFISFVFSTGILIQVSRVAQTDALVVVTETGVHAKPFACITKCSAAVPAVIEATGIIEEIVDVLKSASASNEKERIPVVKTQIHAGGKFFIRTSIPC
jgi:hypothetical protein